MVNLIQWQSGKHKRYDQKYVIVISHANACLNSREWVEVVEWIKDGTLPYPDVLWIVSVCERKP